MIHPATEVHYINSEKGFGLFATQHIPSGTITWILDPLDREFSQSQMDAIEPIFQDILLTYSFRNRKGNYIFCWDNGRYINHSFNANCSHTPYHFEVANRDINAGEEMTNDYGCLNIIEPFEALPESSNRTIVYPDDLLTYADTWDSQLKIVFPKLIQVEQPLKKYINSSTWTTIQEILEGTKTMASIRSCYYDNKA